MKINIHSVKSFKINKSDVSSEARYWLNKRGVKDCRIEVEVVGVKRIKSLNNKYLHRNGSTDVLSFPLNEIPGEKKGGRLIGTIVISNDIIKKQAKEKQTDLRGEFVSLLRHGIDHLVGIHHK